MRKRRRPRPQPDRALTLTPVLLDCPECRHRTEARYNNYRTISTLDGVFRLTLTMPSSLCLRVSICSLASETLTQHPMWRNNGRLA